MDELTALAERYGTDKWGWHRYTPVYDELLAPLRPHALRVLELGVYQGASLQMWRDYFPQARVVGIDVDPPDVSLGERIEVLRGDLGNFRDYLPLVDQEYDLVVDDASHAPEQQMLSLSLLWPRVKRGGFYCIEDVIELAAWTRLLALLFAPVRVFDLRGAHNAVDDVLIVLRKP
jgi:8-demethyl-8-alpha-L-rhamnosyltetracenomycin-C 2'-O-methyltransferase